MLTREDLEKREERELAPFAAKSSRSEGRVHPEKEHPYRTAFQRDRDRIIHSAAFRRLEYKTQVFVNHEGDYYRTRLTHTMETAQIGRSIGRVLELNEDLIEAIALAHDLGHTPFGHSGEKTLDKLMRDYGGFEHNLQSLHVVSELEKRYPDFVGLNLSREVRESLVKHSTRYDHPVRSEFDPDTAPLLEAQVVDVSDSIAYDTHDLDDGLTANILAEDQLMDVALWQNAVSVAQHRHTELNGRLRIYQTVRALVNLLVTDLVNSTSARIAELGLSSIEDVREKGKGVVGFSEKMAGMKSALEEFLENNMYNHYRIKRMAMKAGRFLEEMFNEYMARPEQLPPDYQGGTGRKGTARSVCDYLAGMTDRYAQDEYKKLFHPFERV